MRARLRFEISKVGRAHFSLTCLLLAYYFIGAVACGLFGWTIAAHMLAYAIIYCRLL